MPARAKLQTIQKDMIRLHERAVKLRQRTVQLQRRHQDFAAERKRRLAIQKQRDSNLIARRADK